MISYKHDRKNGLTRRAVESAASDPRLAVANVPAGAGQARDGAGLTRRRVVDYCRVTAAL